MKTIPTDRLPCACCRRRTPVERLRRAASGRLACQHCLDDEATSFEQLIARARLGAREP